VGSAGVSRAGIFGNEQLEELARVAAARCREEIFTQRVPYGPLTAAQAARVEQLQQLLMDDAAWAMRVEHAWDIREFVYATIDNCKRYKLDADEFVKKHPAVGSLVGIVAAADYKRAVAALQR
jgi:hypothetical protein